MNVWLTNTAERLPFDGDGRRLRMGLLAEHLVARGADVTYWTSAFVHVEKRMRTPHTTREQRAGYSVVRLSARGYRRNASIGRILDHRAVAREFLVESRTEPLPDLIISSFPTIEMAAASTRLSTDLGVPSIVDIRDLWPDLFVYLAPPALQPIAKAALAPYHRQAAAALRRATAVTGITSGYRDWGLDLAGRSAGDYDAAIPFTYELVDYPAERRATDDSFWKAQGVGTADPIILFIGSFIRSFDLRPLIESARLLSESGVEAQFVLCGDGEMGEAYRAAANGAENVILPGWVDSAKLRSILDRAAVGIAPLPDRADFRMNINNKTVEYLSAGLPMLVSPSDSYCAAVVEAADCGRGFTLDAPPGLAQALADILSDQPLRERWSRNARQLYQDRFSVDRVLDGWDRVIDGLVQ